MRSEKRKPARMDRRWFLGILGGLSAAPALKTVMAGPFQGPPPGGSHAVPADKKLDPQWIAGLFKKGEVEVYRGKELDTIGMPIGGICAGQLYLRGDGTLGLWQIFNKRHFTGYGATCYRRRPVESPLDQGFALILEEGGRRRLLALNRESFPGVTFRGEYPIGEVKYRRSDLPVSVTLEAFSPFCPLNAADSGLPLTVFLITVKNESKRPVRCGIAGWLENGVCFYSASEAAGKRTSKVCEDSKGTYLIHGAEEAPVESSAPNRPPVLIADFEGEDYSGWKVEGTAFGKGPARGTLPGQQKVSGYKGRGLVNTFLGGDAPTGRLTSPPFTITRGYLNFLIGGGGHQGKTCMNLIVEGRRVRTACGANNEKLTWRSWDVRSFEGKEARLEIVDAASGPWGHINVDHIELADTPRKALEPLRKLLDFGSMALAFAGKAEVFEPQTPPGSQKVPWAGLKGRKQVSYELSERRKGGLATPVRELEPGGSFVVRAFVTWHFPNRPQGNFYATRFNSAQEVAEYAFENFKRLKDTTYLWHKTYYDSTLPKWLLNRLMWPVSNLATGTCQWWGNGRFWAWEGVGCCHGTCTHVWNYAHAMARLFPELERSVREMQDLGEAFHPDGLVGFRGERNGRYAADGQAGTVLKCYREHQMSKDDSFLRRNWPKIKKVLLYLIRQDGNADGLIENSQHNTYDINFFGPNTFVGSLYLAALRAGEEMAREMGEEETARFFRKVFEAGSRHSVEQLWNGEYFIQKVDLTRHPKHQYADGCLSDQLFGQGWAHQLGLGYIYPRELVVKALKSVWKYNWTPDVGLYNRLHKPERWFVSPGEAGLFICTWPKSRYLEQGVRYRNEVWTGIEYQVAGHMVREGLLTEGLVMCRAVHDRYHPSKHNPYNEVECGDHYARALASWGVFTSLAGFEYHGTKGHIGFAPRFRPEDFRAAFTAAEGWGSFSQKKTKAGQEARISLSYGSLSIKSLALELLPGVAGNSVKVEVEGKTVPVSQTVKDRRLELRFESQIKLSEGQALRISCT